MESDRNYLHRRAIEERGAAMQSADQRVRQVHLELAERYARLSQKGDLKLGYSILPDSGGAAPDVAASKG